MQILSLNLTLFDFFILFHDKNADELKFYRQWMILLLKKEEGGATIREGR